MHQCMYRPRTVHSKVTVLCIVISSGAQSSLSKNEQSTKNTTHQAFISNGIFNIVVECV